MKWLKAIGYGVALFAILFVIGSVAMFGLKLRCGSSMSFLMLAAVLAVSWLLARQYKIGSFKEGFEVGLVWVLVDALLEYVVIVQIFNKGEPSFYNWSVLLGYFLIILVPALEGKSTSVKSS